MVRGGAQLPWLCTAAIVVALIGAATHILTFVGNVTIRLGFVFTLQLAVMAMGLVVFLKLRAHARLLENKGRDRELSLPSLKVPYWRSMVIIVVFSYALAATLGGGMAVSGAGSLQELSRYGGGSVERGLARVFSIWWTALSLLICVAGDLVDQRLRALRAIT